MSAFNEGLMTGARLGQGAYRAQGDRRVGGLMSSNNMTGARDELYGQGRVDEAQVLDGRVRQQGVGTALAGGDFDAATTAAGGDVQLLNTIRQWKSSASEQEVQAASRRAENFAQIGIQLLGVQDPMQRRAMALQLAEREGIPVDQIPESLTDELLTGWYQSNMTAAEMLAERKDARDATRPIVGPGGVILMPPGASAPNMGGGAPEYVDQLPPGVRPVNPNQPAPGQPVRATSEMSQPSRVSFQSPDQARNAIGQIVPGVRFTSGTRSVEHNRQVGGVPTSNHVRGRAWDLVPPGGMSMAQLAQKMRSEGFRAIDEGDHVHVSW